jgi:hypothetical protein
LNPSDKKAVLGGSLGLYWLGGHIALEELIAVQTTLLLQHKSFNPEAWSKHSSAIDGLPESVRQTYA